MDRTDEGVRRPVEDILTSTGMTRKRFLQRLKMGMAAAVGVALLGKAGMADCACDNSDDNDCPAGNTCVTHNECTMRNSCHGGNACNTYNQTGCSPSLANVCYGGNTCPGTNICNFNFCYNGDSCGVNTCHYNSCQPGNTCTGDDWCTVNACYNNDVDCGWTDVSCPFSNG
jgi:hypothetical protein